MRTWEIKCVAYILPGELGWVKRDEKYLIEYDYPAEASSFVVENAPGYLLEFRSLQRAAVFDDAGNKTLTSGQKYIIQPAATAKTISISVKQSFTWWVRECGEWRMCIYANHSVF